jgi:hypothetical protein
MRSALILAGWLCSKDALKLEKRSELGKPQTFFLGYLVMGNENSAGIALLHVKNVVAL